MHEKLYEGTWCFLLFSTFAKCENEHVLDFCENVKLQNLKILCIYIGLFESLDYKFSTETKFLF